MYNYFFLNITSKKFHLRFSLTHLNNFSFYPFPFQNSLSRDVSTKTHLLIQNKKENNSAVTWQPSCPPHSLRTSEFNKSGNNE